MLWLLAACLNPSSSAAAGVNLAELGPQAWAPQPSWVGAPATGATVASENGALVFTVNEPHKGMKWCLDVSPWSADLPGYLVARCRAENTLSGGPYALWAFDDGPGGPVIPSAEVPVDGQWHEVAVDLYASGRRGLIQRLAVEVQAGDQTPARLSFSSIRLAATPPDDAVILPRQPAVPKEWRAKFDGSLAFAARTAWLGNPAGEGQYRLEQRDGKLLLTITAAGKGMKWSAQYDTPPDLTGMTFCSVRYRARNVPGFGDYVVWLGSETGGLPQKSATVVGGTQLRADGRWHTETFDVKDLFPVREIAVQAQAAAPEATIEIESVVFSDAPVLLSVREAADITEGWRDLRAPENQFACLDLSHAANSAGAFLARLFGLKDWFTGSQVTVEGIPFQLSRGPSDTVSPPVGSTEPFALPIADQASELFLLMAVRPASQDYTGILGAPPLRSFTAPERFRIAVDYEDGLTDWLFPARAADGVHEVGAGLDAYALSGLRAVKVKQLRLRSAMRNAAFAVAAVTANHGRALVPAEPVPALPPFVPARAVREEPPQLRAETGRLVVSNAYLSAELSLASGVSLTRLDNRCLQGGRMAITPGPLFTLGDGKTRIDSTRVTLGPLKKDSSAQSVSAAVPFDARPAGVPLTGQLNLKLGRGPELELSLDLTHAGEGVLLPEVSFPVLKRLTIGGAGDTWYLDTRQGGVISRAPWSTSERYSGRHPLQVTDFFNPRLGGGLYVMAHDLQDVCKYFTLAKSDTGADFSVDYTPREYGPGETIELAPAAIAAHTGDWREALAAYRRWTATWYRPQAPRKQWFRECFNYRQHLLREGLYDFASKTYHMQEVLQKDIDFFGRVDYFHLFDFGQSDPYGRVGDYNHYDEIGGVQALADAIRGVQGKGVRVGLYLEGYLVDERSVFGRQHVKDWGIAGPSGQLLLWEPGSTEHFMCPACVGWQDYLAATYRRVASELHPDGLYIDEHGFADGGKTCFGKTHGHFVPMPPSRGEQAMDRKIRAATPVDIATLTEETPTDVNSQFQDGALSYSVAFNAGDTRLAPHHADLFRFCFPDFKVFQLVSYNNFIEGGWGLLKYPFFNGEGTWLGNGIPSGFDADAQAFLRRAFRLLHEHRAAFTSDDVEPLVPTESPAIYANRFSTPTETVWTLHNLGDRTYRGPVLRLPHVRGATYRDLWNDRPLEPRVDGGQALLSVEIGPGEIGCVAATK